MNVHIVHAFTKDGSGGNIAGVVLCTESYSTEQMQECAQHAGYSETAFIEIISHREQHIRFFAPTKEVALCGHATIASYSWMFAQGLIRQGSHHMHCLAGTQNIIVEKDGAVSMSQNLPTFGDILSPEPVAQCLGIHTSQFDSTLPIQIASTGLHKIFVPLRSLHDLNSIRPDFHAIIALAQKHHAIGMYCYTRETLYHNTAHCRNFAPVVGIFEDSATGTSAAALSTLLHHFGLLSTNSEINLCYEQGYFIQTPAEIHVRLVQKENHIQEVWVRGYATCTEA